MEGLFHKGKLTKKEMLAYWKEIDQAFDQYDQEYLFERDLK